MNISEIRQLAGILRESGLSRLEIAEGNLRIVLESSSARVIQTFDDAPPATTMEVYERVAPGVTVTSPLVGTVYLSPQAGSPPFAALGDRVEKGDTLCIVESMKMFNEIEATASGVVTEICVKNGQAVDYGQSLFVLSGEANADE